MITLRVVFVNLLICLFSSILHSQGSVVKVYEKSPENWVLKVDGNPFYIIGVSNLFLTLISNIQRRYYTYIQAVPSSKGNRIYKRGYTLVGE